MRCNGAYWIRAYEEVRAAYMRVFDFDGTIYDGDSRFDQPMIDMARRAYMVKGDKIHQVK